MISSSFDSMFSKKIGPDSNLLFRDGLLDASGTQRRLLPLRDLEAFQCMSRRGSKQGSECSTASVVIAVHNLENLNRVLSDLATFSVSEFSCFAWITNPQPIETSKVFSIHPGLWSGSTVSLAAIELSLHSRKMVFRPLPDNSTSTPRDFPHCPRLANFDTKPSRKIDGMGPDMGMGMGRRRNQPYVLDLSTECSGFAAGADGSLEQIDTCSSVCNLVSNCVGFSMDLEYGFCVLFRAPPKHTCFQSVTAQPPPHHVTHHTLSALSSRNCLTAATADTYSRTTESSEARAAPETVESTSNVSDDSVDWIPAEESEYSTESADHSANQTVTESEPSTVSYEFVSSVEAYSRASDTSTYSVDGNGQCSSEVSGCEGDAECGYWLQRVKNWAQASLAKGNPVSMSEYVAELIEETSDVSNTAAPLADAMIDCLIANSGMPICPRGAPTEGSSCFYSASNPLSCGYEPSCCECANVQPICVNGTFAQCQSNGQWTIHTASINCIACPKCTTFDWRFVGVAVDISALPVAPKIPNCSFNQTASSYSYRGSHFYLSTSCTGDLAVAGSTMQKKACQYLCSSISSCKSWTLHLTTGHCYLFQDTSCDATGCLCTKCSCLNGQCYFQSNDLLYLSGYNSLSCVSDFSAYVSSSSVTALSTAATGSTAVTSCSGCPQNSWCVKGEGIAAACVTCLSGNGCDVPVMYGHDTGLSFVCQASSKCSFASKLDVGSALTTPYLSVVTTEFSNSNGFDGNSEAFQNAVQTVIVSDVEDHGSSVLEIYSSVGTHGTKLLQSFIIESSTATAYAFDSSILSGKIESDIQVRIGDNLDSSDTHVAVYAVVSKAAEYSSSSSSYDSDSNYNPTSANSGTTNGNASPASGISGSDSKSSFLQSPAFIMLTVCATVITVLGVSYFKKTHLPSGSSSSRVGGGGGDGRRSSAGGVLDDNGRHLYGAVQNESLIPKEHPHSREVKVTRNSTSVRTSSKVQRMSDRSILLHPSKKVVPEGSVPRFSEVRMDLVDEDRVAHQAVA